MLIIAEAHGLPPKKFPDSRNYFVPSMLQLYPTKLSEGARAASNCITPAPLFMMFTTEYLPPGFFIRFAALLSKESKCQLYMKYKIYQDHIVFKYGENNQGIDQIKITEEKSSIWIDVNRINYRRNGYPFLFSTCHEIVRLLQSSSKEVLNLMLPSVEMCLYLKCENCILHQKHGWIHLPPERCDIEPTLECENCYNSCDLKPEQKIWLDIKDVRNVLLFFYFLLLINKVHLIYV